MMPGILDAWILLETFWKNDYNEKMDGILIGTSGYDYPEWKVFFYPENLARKDFLPYYATKFNALELNGTFYNMPTPERMQSFVDRSEKRIFFSVKAPKFLTHEIGFSWKEMALEFNRSLEPMSGHGLLSSILFQFPRDFCYSVENRKYLDALLGSFKGFPCAVEFRNALWCRKSVLEGLGERNASFVFCDMPEFFECNGKLRSNFAGPMSYCRLHARNPKSWYSSDCSERNFYDEAELQKFLPVLKSSLDENRKPMLFFRKDIFGVMNALCLASMIKSF